MTDEKTNPNTGTDQKTNQGAKLQPKCFWWRRPRLYKYETECKTAWRSFNTLRQLPTDSVAYDTELLMLERYMPKVRALAPPVPSAAHLIIQSFLDAPDTRQRLETACVRIQQIATGRNRKAVLKANERILKFQRQARWAKSVGGGYEKYTQVPGGAVETNGRRH